MSDYGLFSTFLLGLLGTGHCIGMCGPLVLAFPGRSGGFLPHLFYHGGRISTYVLIGMLMGGIAAGLMRIPVTSGGDPLQWVARIQIGLSLLAGGFLLYLGLAQLGFLREPGWMAVAHPEKIPGYSRIIRAAYLKGHNAQMLLTGMIMGFLPCGLSYAAFSRALASGDPIEGALLLAAFGMGTLPGLLLLGTGASRLARKYRRHLDLVAGLLMLAMGLSLTVRATVAIL